MLEKILSNKVYNLIKFKFDLDSIYEVRIRNQSPIVIGYKGVYVYLKDEVGNFVIANKTDIDRVVNVVSNYSLYTVENQIKHAFITTECGYRVGISGEFIYECGSNNIRSMKNIYSVNIRVPHIIRNVSHKAFKYIYSELDNKLNSTLIISKPGVGKTTYLRDICYQISKLSDPKNVLLLDERYEIAGVKDGKVTMDVGGCCDILSGTSKKYGFNEGIRALKPDIILTDELICEDDYLAVSNAINSGVCVIATIHSDSLESLFQKFKFDILLNQKCFERYILLDSKQSTGVVLKIYDKNFKSIYC